MSKEKGIMEKENLSKEILTWENNDLRELVREITMIVNTAQNMPIADRTSINLLAEFSLINTYIQRSSETIDNKKKVALKADSVFNKIKRRNN